MSFFYNTRALKKQLLFFVLIVPLVSFSQIEIDTTLKPDPLVSYDAKAQRQWVDSVYAQMGAEDKIGQLFMTMVFSSQSKQETEAVKEQIKKYKLGGIIFSKGGPVRQAKLTNSYQKESKIPLLIGQDAEWGLAMRLDSTYAFPWNLTLGAIEDNDLIRQFGRRLGAQTKRMGMQINFAPDVDININPQNPIIGNRSFGEDRVNVTEKGLSFVRGMESKGVLSSIKHFPGHGDTDIDSHNALPILNFSRARMDSIELYPFRNIIPYGVSSVMVSHLEVPVLDSRKNQPASLSKPIVTGLLKEDWQYTGLIITDGLQMKGVTQGRKPGDPALQAFLAGNDILLIPAQVKESYNALLQAYHNGQISEDRLAHSVKKILMAKYKTGLHKWKPIKLDNLVADLNTVRDELLYARLIENAITVIQNKASILPIKDLDEKKIAYVEMGDAKGDAFYNRLKKYGEVDRVTASNDQELMEQLKKYNVVFIGFHKPNDNPWQSYKFKQSEKNRLAKIAAVHPTILSVFASPYALLDVPPQTIADLDGIVVGYQNSNLGQEKTADILFGSVEAKGKLPVGIGDTFPVGTQIKTESLQRLSYGLPESVGMDTKKLQKVDSIANYAIAHKMTPGMQIVVARKGRVVLQKSYGYHTYDNLLPVKNDDVYDLASMTKVLAALPLYMELVDKGTITFETTLGEILPFLRGTNKADITLKKALSHYARIEPYIKFYEKTLGKDGKPSSAYYRKEPDAVFNIPVAEDLYLRKDYADTIYKAIADSPLEPKLEYKYSDFPFYLSKKYLEHAFGNDLNQVTQDHFYKSLGANHLGYLPLERFPKSAIVPTEKDDYFRMQTIQGYVHDEGAAMLGGISGHAGLFGNANDVAKMSQLYLNGGQYGGKTYFSPGIVDKFNTCYYCNENVNRGVGFHKPQNEGDPGIAFDGISKKSFGHTGFTGTITWIDPEEEIVYVLLSNRVNPTRDSIKFITENIRTEIQKQIYKSIITY